MVVQYVRSSVRSLLLLLFRAAACAGTSHLEAQEERRLQRGATPAKGGSFAAPAASQGLPRHRPPALTSATSLLPGKQTRASGPGLGTEKEGSGNG